MLRCKIYDTEFDRDEKVEAFGSLDVFEKKYQSTMIDAGWTSRQDFYAKMREGSPMPVLVILVDKDVSEEDEEEQVDDSQQSKGNPSTRSSIDTARTTRTQGTQHFVDAESSVSPEDPPLQSPDGSVQTKGTSRFSSIAGTMTEASSSVFGVQGSSKETSKGDKRSGL